MPIATIQHVPSVSICSCCDAAILDLAHVILFPEGRVEDYCDACYSIIASWR